MNTNTMHMGGTMPDYYDNHLTQQGASSVRPVIESASGTTSPDNPNSGPTAYVLFAVGVAVLGLVLSTILGFFSVLVPYAISELGNVTSSDTSNTESYGETRTTQNTEGLSEQNSSVSQSLTAAEALDLNLAPYSSLIDDEVSAFDYSGANTSVTQCVRSVVKVDKDAAASVARDLNAAARDSSTTTERLDSALATCGQAISDLQSIEVPSSASSSVSTQLEQGISGAGLRWQLIEAEISLLKAGGDISYEDLATVDAKIWDATEQTGSSLTEALTLSAGE